MGNSVDCAAWTGASLVVSDVAPRWTCCRRGRRGLLALAATVSAKEPRLTVSPSLMTGALTCYGDVNDRRPPPILVLPGTGSDGSQVYARQGRLRRDRALGLYVEPPRSCDGRLADIGSVRRACGSGTFAGPRRRITVAGISQGGLLARLALTHWPSLRTRVADVVTAAAPHRGAQAPPGGAASALPGVPAGNMAAGGGLKLHAGPQQRPRRDAGRTAYTTVRSATDEVVRPQSGRAPTSALKGAANILIQDVCRGRATSPSGQRSTRSRSRRCTTPSRTRAQRVRPGFERRLCAPIRQRTR